MLSTVSSHKSIHCLRKTMLVGTVSVLFLALFSVWPVAASPVNSDQSTSAGSTGENKQSIDAGLLIEPSSVAASTFYLPERAVRAAQFNSRFAQRISPFALKHFIASRLQNNDFGKRMGSEFLGKRSSQSSAGEYYPRSYDVESNYNEPDVAYLLEKKMGSEFLG